MKDFISLYIYSKFTCLKCVLKNCDILWCLWGTTNSFILIKKTVLPLLLRSCSLELAVPAGNGVITIYILKMDNLPFIATRSKVGNSCLNAYVFCRCHGPAEGLVYKQLAIELLQVRDCGVFWWVTFSNTVLHMKAKLKQHRLPGWSIGFK